MPTRITEERRIVGTSIAPPACRLAWVYAWANDGHLEHLTLPVVALRCDIIRTYTIEHDVSRTPRTSHSEADLLNFGWVLSGETIETHPLVPDDMDLMTAEGTLDGGDVAFGRLAVCHWPAGEDPVRLAPTVDAVRRDVLDEVNRRASARREAESAC